MTERSGQPDARTRSHDELLEQLDSAAMESASRKDPELARAARVQAEVDAGLKRLFAGGAAAESAPARKISSARWISWAAAAGLLMTVAGVWWFWSQRTGPDALGPLYRVCIAANMKPEVICNTDDEFANWCRAYFRQPIFPTAHPDGLELVGWGVKDAPATFTGILLARYKGEPIVVAMNRVDRNGVITPGPVQDPQIHVHKKRIGDVNLWEISTFSEARVLPTLAAKKPAR